MNLVDRLSKRNESRRVYPNEMNLAKRNESRRTKTTCKGWLIAEQTMSGKASGYRVVFASSDVSSLIAVNEARDKASPVIEYPVHLICLGVKPCCFAVLPLVNSNLNLKSNSVLNVFDRRTRKRIILIR